MVDKNLDQELRELLNDPLFWIMITIFIIILITMLSILLHSHLSNKIHNSYHKGYNKAKSDKVQYYKTIKKIIDKYNEICKEFDDIEVLGHTAFIMKDFKIYLNKKYSN